MYNILILDDDIFIISSLQDLFSYQNINVHGFLTPEAATSFLLGEIKPSLAIVDLFLEGDGGDKLSNDFIKNELITREIKYVRLTSAPRLVPPEFSGIEIFDKRKVFNTIQDFASNITKILNN